MVYCKICGAKSVNRICDGCQYCLNNGADEETIKKMKSNDVVNKIWEENGVYSERLAEVYYDSVIENYRQVEDSKENFGYNTFIDGIRLGLDIVVPMLDEDSIKEIRAKIEDMISQRGGI